MVMGIHMCDQRIAFYMVRDRGLVCCCSPLGAKVKEITSVPSVVYLGPVVGM